MMKKKDRSGDEASSASTVIDKENLYVCTFEAAYEHLARNTQIVFKKAG